MSDQVHRVNRPADAARGGRRDLACLTCTARGMTFCDALAAGDLSQLSGLAEFQTFSRGAVVIDEQAPAKAIYNITRGALRRVTTFADGRRAVVGFLFRGDTLGLDSDCRHRFGAEALCEVTVCRFQRRKLEAMFAETVCYQEAVRQRISADLRAAEDHMVLLSRRRAIERVALFLIALAEKQRARGRPPSPIRLPMGREDIADYLGLTIETISRTVTRLRADRLISCGNGQVTIIDPAGLAALADGADMAPEVSGR